MRVRLAEKHDKARSRGRVLRAGAIHERVALGLVASWLGALLAGLPAAMAMHEVDHRYTVEGFVCGPDGQPVSSVQVIAKDTRASIGATALTDDRGYYKITLHLHNENRGDPVLVIAREEERQITAQFDVKDTQTERKVRVNFGTGCEVATDDGPPVWVWYGAGALVLAGAALAGMKAARKRRPGGKGARR
jgi:MYXO-CTERM domain-containing protein